MIKLLLSFRQEYSAYPCNGTEKQEMSFADNAASEGLTKVSGSSTFEENEAEWDTLPERKYDTVDSTRFLPNQSGKIY